MKCAIKLIVWRVWIMYNRSVQRTIDQSALCWGSDSLGYLFHPTNNTRVQDQTYTSRHKIHTGVSPGGRLNMNMPSYQYGDPHYRDNMVSLPSYLYMEIAWNTDSNTRKDGFILKQDLALGAAYFIIYVEQTNHSQKYSINRQTKHGYPSKTNKQTNQIKPNKKY